MYICTLEIFVSTIATFKDIYTIHQRCSFFLLYAESNTRTPEDQNTRNPEPADTKGSSDNTPRVLFTQTWVYFFKFTSDKDLFVINYMSCDVITIWVLNYSQFLCSVVSIVNRETLPLQRHIIFLSFSVIVAYSCSLMNCGPHIYDAW